MGLNIAINLATTGKVGFVSAVKETISSAVDPTKTVKKVKRLRKLVGVNKVTKKADEVTSTLIHESETGQQEAIPMPRENEKRYSCGVLHATSGNVLWVE